MDAAFLDTHLMMRPVLLTTKISDVDRAQKNGSPIDTRLTKIRVNHNKWVYVKMNK